MGQWWVITEDNEGSITKPERFFRSNSDNCRKQAIALIENRRPCSIGVIASRVENGRSDGSLPFGYLTEAFAALPQSGQSQRKGAALCSWALQEAQVESCERQDNSYIHRQPF